MYKSKKSLKNQKISIILAIMLIAVTIANLLFKNLNNYIGNLLSRAYLTLLNYLIIFPPYIKLSLVETLIRNHNQWLINKNKRNRKGNSSN